MSSRGVDRKGREMVEYAAVSPGQEVLVCEVGRWVEETIEEERSRRQRKDDLLAKRTRNTAVALRGGRHEREKEGDGWHLYLGRGRSIPPDFVQWRDINLVVEPAGERLEWVIPPDAE